MCNTQCVFSCRMRKNGKHPEKFTGCDGEQINDVCWVRVLALCWLSWRDTLGGQSTLPKMDYFHMNVICYTQLHMYANLPKIGLKILYFD